ncbi:isocitrate/isopropylmalate dehydrogenase family protein [Paenibacillus hamazuiensis]|uniref:isocitrate/isopropylmalate dehydrogenase family protein n=1 Tax=Paenibacillus hamazuiensis TaxID=2936508 RepID=UPI002010B568|nr:isocitrate/isopropylmalate dehydrogenase family protein [Paenibacillus hamazuiensis]
MLKIGVIEGNGIGPEVTKAALDVLEATGLSFEWIPIPTAQQSLERYGHPLAPEVIQLIKDVKVSIKGPLIVEKQAGRINCVQPDGSEITYPSINNAIRRELQLFVAPRPIRGFKGISGPFEKLDVVIMREITEDVYSALEHKIGDYAAEAIKLTTREAVVRVARFSFEYARKHKRKKVTCVHKANALSYTDGLFLQCCREVALEYPDIPFDDFMVDAACYFMVKDPSKFDVIVTSNQYGDILSDLAGGLAGSLGLAPGANIGENYAVYEASHGAAPDIAGKGIANPIALVLSGAEMLSNLGYPKEGKAIVEATHEVVSSGKTLTPDLGGTASTTELTSAIVQTLKTKLQATI